MFVTKAITPSVFFLILHEQKQKLEQEPGADLDLPVSNQALKVRKFPQKQPVAKNESENKPKLSKDILAGVSFRYRYSAIYYIFHFELPPETCE